MESAESKPSQGRPLQNTFDTRGNVTNQAGQIYGNVIFQSQSDTVPSTLELLLT